MALEWKGVMPAMTTCFKEDLSIDRDFAATHARWLVNHGCTGIVTPGSLGEGATLTFEEKVALWQTCVRAPGGGAPLVAAISWLSPAEAGRLAQSAADQGRGGWVVRPPSVYRRDWRELMARG